LPAIKSSDAIIKKVQCALKKNQINYVKKNFSLESRLHYNLYHSTAHGTCCELSICNDDTADKNASDIKRQSVEFVFAANSQKIPTIPGNALDKFMNVTTLNLINVSLSNITYRHFKDMVQLKYLDLSCNKLRKLPRKLFKECENLTDLSFTNNQVRKFHETIN